MNTVRREGGAFYLDSCWAPPKRLVARRDNPLLTPDVLRAVIWLRRHPKARTCTVSGEPSRLAGGVGSFSDDLVEGLLPEYRKQIKKYEKTLYDQGKKTGQKVAGAVWGRVFNPPPAKASGPKWLPKVIDPVLNPFVAGLSSEVGPKLLAPIAGGLLLGLAGIFGLGYAIGRRRSAAR